MMQEAVIHHAADAQREFFNSNQTRDISFRKEQLKKLLHVLKNNEHELMDALHADLGKSQAESYMTELAMGEEEIETQLKNLDSWAQPQHASGNMATFPSKSTVYYEPYGVVLIIVPWNYPINLSITPLAGAMAAGNTVIMKCSRNNKRVWPVLQKMLNCTFPENYIFCVDADSDYDAVLHQKYDYIFFTGSPNVGKTIMKTAAENLTPVSLELGGKSPCIVDATANLKIAAKRIVWGKFLNAGQTCISIDYVLVQESVKDAFVREMQAAIEDKYADAENSDSYPCIISQKEYDRLCRLLETETNVIGGRRNDAARKISPTLMPSATFDSEIMKNEIFGPLLPIIGFADLDELLREQKKLERPLACYVFSEDMKAAQKVITTLPFGGGCINDVMMHISNNHLPFGGLGNSGMGCYHGRYSFETFSHKKGIITSSTKIDLELRYAPFDEKKLALLKKLI